MKHKTLTIVIDLEIFLLRKLAFLFVLFDELGVDPKKDTA